MAYPLKHPAPPARSPLANATASAEETARIHASAPGDSGEAPELGAQTVALVGLLILAVLYTLYVARDLILPVVLSVILSLVLWPMVRGLKRLRVPEGLGALIILVGLAGIIGSAGYTLSGPAAGWLESAPQTFHRIEARVRALKAAVEPMRHATDQVEKLATVDDPVPTVAVQGPGMGSLLLFATWKMVAGSGAVLILTYFLLASGDHFLRKGIALLPTLHDKKRMVAMSREMQESISAYLFTLSLINAGFGIAVGVAMAALGMPNPMLWGAMAAALEFIPFIGSAVGISVVGAVAMASFEGLGDTVLPPLTYLLCATALAYVVSPVILSRRFTLNPVVVLLGLLFWGWIWGIPGALIAVPLLVTLRIMCEYVPSLGVVGEFLGD